MDDLARNFKFDWINLDNIYKWSIFCVGLLKGGGMVFGCFGAVFLLKIRHNGERSIIKDHLFLFFMMIIEIFLFLVRWFVRQIEAELSKNENVCIFLPKLMHCLHAAPNVSNYFSQELYTLLLNSEKKRLSILMQEVTPVSRTIVCNMLEKLDLLSTFPLITNSILNKK